MIRGCASEENWQGREHGAGSVDAATDGERGALFHVHGEGTATNDDIDGEKVWGSVATHVERLGGVDRVWGGKGRRIRPATSSPEEEDGDDSEQRTASGFVSMSQGKQRISARHLDISQCHSD